MNHQNTDGVTIDVISDVMCPWCMIGKKRLEDALAMIDGEIAVTVRWHPYQLDATLPKEGLDRRTYLENKFGGPERAKQIYANIEKAGKEAGIQFDFDKITVSPNTADAHRLIMLAGRQGADIQNTMVEALFTAFFINGENIGDQDFLVALAKNNGLSPEGLAAWKAGAGTQELKAQVEQAREIGVTGVPFFILNQKLAIAGAQPPQAMAQAIRQAAA